MKYGKYVINYTPRLLRIILLFVAGLLIMGGLLGFAAGVVSAKALTHQEEVPILLPSLLEETPTVDETIEIVETIEPINVYYDCPLDHDLQDYIRELCDENGVPMPLVIAMIKVESSFRESVISKTNDYGLMQINKINHEWLSEKYGVTDFLDPYQNVLCGIKILSQHYNRFQDTTKALMAYNLGATGAKRKWDAGIYETAYTQKIQAAMEEYENEI